MRLLLVLLIFCFSFGEVLISAKGLGKTVKEAKRDALREISQTILSKVVSSIEVEKRLEGSKFSKKVISNISVSSDLILKGVEFSKPRKRGKYYEVVGYFTRDSLRDTVDYLKSKVYHRLENLSRAQLRRALEYSYYLMALLTFAGDEEEIKKLKSYQEEILRRLNSGVVSFLVYPEDAKVFLNNRRVKTFTPIYLREGEYSFKVERKGYRGVRGRFYIAKGETLSIPVRLVPKFKSKVEVFTFSQDPKLREVLEASLRDYGIKVTDNPKVGNAFFLTYRDEKTKVDEYTKHTLFVFLSAYKDGKLYRRVKAKVSFVTTEETQSRIFYEKLNSLIPKMVSVLLSKMDLKNFWSQKPYDYSELK